MIEQIHRFLSSKRVTFGFEELMGSYQMIFKSKKILSTRCLRKEGQTLTHHSAYSLGSLQ